MADPANPISAGAMTYLAVTSAFVLGLLLFPAVLFIRARRSDNWDRSNIFNMYRVVAHLAIRPADFGDMHYPDGSRPFWYIGQDEFSEVVRTARHVAQRITVEETPDGRTVYNVDVGDMSKEDSAEFLAEVRASLEARASQD